jgi:hypothetical protein
LIINNLRLPRGMLRAGYYALNWRRLCDNVARIIRRVTNCSDSGPAVRE